MCIIYLQSFHAVHSSVQFEAQSASFQMLYAAALVCVCVGRYDWFQSSKAVTIVVYTRWKKIQPDHVTIDKIGKTLRVDVSIDKHTFKIHLGMWICFLFGYGLGF